MRSGILLILFFGWAGFAHAGVGIGGKQWEVVERVGKGDINWTTGILQATGVGAPNEKGSGKKRLTPVEAAREDALQNLLAVVKALRIDPQTTVEGLALKNRKVKDEVLNLVRQADIIEPVKHLSDRSVEVMIEMNLYGGFAQLVLPEEIKHVESIKPVKPVKQPSSSQSATGPGEALPNDPKIFTGLVVDARGLKIKPVLTFKIRDENNREVYGPAFVSREFVVQQGMGLYIKNLKAAKSLKRVIHNPLIVKGLRAVDSESSEIIISDADASKIRSASEHLLFLKKCRVVVVVD